MARRWIPGMLAAALALAPGASWAAPADEFLDRLKSPAAAERVRAAQELGEKGRMAYSAPLAALLKDPDSLVRDAAHEALWAIWMRSDDPEVDALMRRGVVWMNEGLLDQAIESFRVAQDAPLHALRINFIILASI